MDFLVIAIIAGSCLLAGLAIGFMSRNGTVDTLTADRDRANARADKLADKLNTAIRSAEGNGEPRSYGGWSSPSGRREQRRTSAHGTVRPMPRQYGSEYDTEYVPPAPYEYESVRYEETRTERTEDTRTEPAYESRTDTYSAPDTGSSSYGGSDSGSSSSDSGSSSW